MELLTCGLEGYSPRMSRPWGRVGEVKHRRLRDDGRLGMGAVVGWLLNQRSGEVGVLDRERRGVKSGDADEDAGCVWA